MNYGQEKAYRKGLEYTHACTICNIYEVDEDRLKEELIDDAFGC